jgi:hypothetical protein
MNKTDLHAAAERVLARLKAMSNEELKSALEKCADGPISYAFKAVKSRPCLAVSSAFFLNKKTLLLQHTVREFETTITPKCDSHFGENDAANDNLYSLAA